MIRQSEHDAVGAALAAYEQALDHYDDVCLGGADDWVIQEALEDCDNLCELLAAAREVADDADRKIHRCDPPSPPAETAWLRDVRLEW